MALWDKITSRGDIEDRRGTPLSGAGLGGIGALLVIGSIVFSVMNGGQLDLKTAEQLLTAINDLQGTTKQVDTSQFAGEDGYEVFASKVIGSSNDTWSEVFTQNNKSYEKPRLVLFRQATQSGCGVATSEVGPHYCPADQTIYLDETFFEELTRRFGAKGGDVAQAYVMAHEVGHHVQNQLGVLERSQASNEQSVATELQADCYAGIWAKSVSRAGIISPAEILQATDAAAAVGDDRIQQSVGQRVDPESWTHGSSEDRVRWFTAGYDSGTPASCNTFAS